MQFLYFKPCFLEQDYADAGNDCGYLAQVILSALQGIGSKVYRTDLDGTS
jgi:hypothetical protein